MTTVRLRNLCADCGRPITGGATRCRPCDIAYRWREGDWVDRRRKRPVCMDCGKPLTLLYPLSGPQSKRCRRCAVIHKNSQAFDQQYIRDRAIINDAGCWIWQQSLDPQGYPNGKVGGEWGAHRLAYRLWHGPIPAGTEIDHGCHDPDTCKVSPNECPHRACVNPDHLIALTRRDNARKSGNPWGVNARKTHCKRGHEFTPENTIRTPKGGRRCRTCHYAQSRETKRRARERARQARAALSLADQAVHVLAGLPIRM